jgi:hypothetical protein
LHLQAWQQFLLVGRKVNSSSLQKPQHLAFMSTLPKRHSHLSSQNGNNKNIYKVGAGLRWRVGKAKNFVYYPLRGAWLIRHLFKWDSTVATGSRNGASISQVFFLFKEKLKKFI